MRSIGRIAFLSGSLTLAAIGAYAQDPDAASPAAPPAPEGTPVAEQATGSAPASITLPENDAPIAKPDDAVEAAAVGSLQDSASPPPSGGPNPAPTVDVEPLPPPAPRAGAGIDTAAIASPLSEEGTPRGSGVSDWIFLGILSLAAAVILGRLTRRQRESLSILDRRVPQPPSGPPIVQRS